MALSDTKRERYHDYSPDTQDCSPSSIGNANGGCA
jgi:hypothetical protein